MIGRGLWSAIAGVAVTGCGGSLPAAEATPPDGPVEVQRIGSENESGGGEDLQQSDEPREREPRPTVRAAPFRVADLPVAVIPPPLDASRAPTSLAVRGGPTGADELTREPGADGLTNVRLTLATPGQVRLRIGDVESANREGLRVRCGEARKTMTAMRWEALERPAGKARYTVVNAWFDPATCRHAVVERATVELAPILGKVLFAFRECRWACDDGQRITVLGPSLRDVTATALGRSAAPRLGGFATITLDLEPGGGSSMRGRVPAPSLDAWLGEHPPHGSGKRAAIGVGVDVTQSVGDPPPVAVAYVEEPAPAREERARASE